MFRRVLLLSLPATFAMLACDGPTSQPPEYSPADGGEGVPGPAAVCGLPSTIEFFSDGEVIVLSLKNCGERDLVVDSIDYCADAQGNGCTEDPQIRIGPIDAGPQELRQGETLEIPVTFSADAQPHHGEVVVQTDVATVSVHVSAPAL